MNYLKDVIKKLPNLQNFKIDLSRNYFKKQLIKEFRKDCLNAL